MIINRSRLLIAACLLALCGGSSSVFAAAPEKKYTYVVSTPKGFRLADHPNGNPQTGICRVSRRGSLAESTQCADGSWEFKKNDDQNTPARKEQTRQHIQALCVENELESENDHLLEIESENDHLLEDAQAKIELAQKLMRQTIDSQNPKNAKKDANALINAVKAYKKVDLSEFPPEMHSFMDWGTQQMYIYGHYALSLLKDAA